MKNSIKLNNIELTFNNVIYKTITKEQLLSLLTTLDYLYKQQLISLEQYDNTTDKIIIRCYELGFNTLRDK